MSDWLSAFYHALDVRSFDEYVSLCPVSVNQLSMLIFIKRPELAKHHYNDVIKAVQGPYSLHPKWLTDCHLGFVGEIEKKDDTLTRRVNELRGRLGLKCLMTVKFNDTFLLPEKT